MTISVVRERAALKDLIDLYTKRVKDLDAQIVVSLAGREEAVIDGFKVTYKIEMKRVVSRKS